MQEEHVCTQDNRFGRIEQSLEAMQKVLEKLSELLVNKAACDVRIQNIERLLLDFESRLRALEGTSRTNTGTLKWVERIAWIIVAAGVGAATNL
jgi:uncharacterized protein YwgA